MAETEEPGIFGLFPALLPTSP